jgi:hypothetical protein
LRATHRPVGRNAASYIAPRRSALARDPSPVGRNAASYIAPRSALARDPSPVGRNAASYIAPRRSALARDALQPYGIPERVVANISHEAGT